MSNTRKFTNLKTFNKKKKLNLNKNNGNEKYKVQKESFVRAAFLNCKCLLQSLHSKKLSWALEINNKIRKDYIIKWIQNSLIDNHFEERVNSWVIACLKI